LHPPGTDRTPADRQGDNVAQHSDIRQSKIRFAANDGRNFPKDIRLLENRVLSDQRTLALINTLAGS
jgi:hypothetical protein